MLQIGILLLSALLLGRLARYLGLSAVAGELCAGVLLGPTVLAQLWPGLGAGFVPGPAGSPRMFESVGQIGVVLLVGITGTQLDLRLVRRRGSTALRVSLAGVALPLALGVLVGILLPVSLLPDTAERSTFALFLGVAMGVSAIPVIAKTLTELRLLHRNVGQLILCAVTVDDIIGWILLSVVSAMATTGVHTGSLVISIGSVVGAIGFVVLLRPAARIALRAAERSDRASADGVTVALVVIMIILGAAGAAAIDLEPVFGAFIVGIMIGSCDTLSPARLAPVRTVVLAVLAPLFFATAGLKMDLTALSRPVVLLAGICVLVTAVVGKFAGAYLGARLSRIGHWEALALGAGMNARGVIEIVIATVGLQLGVLGVEMFTIIVLVAIVTSMMAPPILRLTMARVEQSAEERLRAEEAEVTPVVVPETSRNV